MSIDHLKGGAPEIYRKLAELTGTQSQLAILERRYQAQINALKATLTAKNNGIGDSGKPGEKLM